MTMPRLTLAAYSELCRCAGFWAGAFATAGQRMGRLQKWATRKAATANLAVINQRKTES